MARHVADAVEHREVGDSLLLQAVDEPIARARRRHADAGVSAFGHASGPTQVRSSASAAISVTRYSVPARGSARIVIHDMLKHLCSAVSYGGAQSLQELREQFWADPERYLVRLSDAGRTESFQR